MVDMGYHLLSLEHPTRASSLPRAQAPLEAQTEVFRHASSLRCSLSRAQHGLIFFLRCHFAQNYRFSSLHPFRLFVRTVTQSLLARAELGASREFSGRARAFPTSPPTRTPSYQVRTHTQKYKYCKAQQELASRNWPRMTKTQVLPRGHIPISTAEQPPLPYVDVVPAPRHW